MLETNHYAYSLIKLGFILSFYFLVHIDHAKSQEFENGLTVQKLLKLSDQPQTINSVHQNHDKVTFGFLNFKDDLSFMSYIFIKLYQIFISSQYKASCMFCPSCSEYAHQAIAEHGLIGTLMSSDRIQRCNGIGMGYYGETCEDGRFIDYP